MKSIHTHNPVILKVEGLKKYFPLRRGFFQRLAGKVRAVDGVSFEIEQGKTLGLVGESGCGKSTVARLILKLLESDEGKIFYQGQDIQTFSEKKMKPLRKKMQIIFQDPFGSLNPRMTIGQTIEEGLRILGIQNRQQRKARLQKLLEMVGMSAHSADRYPHEFSGGQRQRIGIARALSVEPDLIICDEPISALDVSIQAQIINLLNDLQDKLGLSYLFISHDLNVVGYLSHKVAVMYQGQIMEYAPADRIFENPQHPYTLALLAAIPNIRINQKKDKENKLKVLGGEPPDPLNPSPGCKFQTRCPFAESHCRKNEICLKEISKEHFIRCSRAL
ncbi:MAG: ATP-binding cassette domain-containing protein [Desulfobacterales bacterium]|nr:ATP-binding cassette domain-containing protein [Desulfobacterales bacterium]